MIEWRCKNPLCHRLLMRIALHPETRIQIKCPKCGTPNFIPDAALKSDDPRPSRQRSAAVL